MFVYFFFKKNRVLDNKNLKSQKNKYSVEVDVYFLFVLQQSDKLATESVKNGGFIDPPHHPKA
jgi:hypothetical protein